MKSLTQAKRVHPRATMHRQRGAVLYVALIMLILLAILGVVGMQVAGMQEKMSSNYRATNLAFQNSEAAVRGTEDAVEKIANREAAGANALVSSGDIQQRCDDGYDPILWVQQSKLGSKPLVNVRQIDGCIQGEGTLDMGKPLDKPTAVYQITGYAADSNADGSSSTAIDTVFKL